MIDVDKVEPLTSELIKDIDFVVTGSRFPILFTGISDREKAFLELQKHTSGFSAPHWVPKAPWLGSREKLSTRKDS